MAEHDWLNGSNSGIDASSEERYSRSQPIARHELRPLTTGEILDRTFFLYRSNFWLYLGEETSMGAALRAVRGHSVMTPLAIIAIEEPG